MDRVVLTDAQWATTEPHYLGKLGDPGRTGMDGRLFLEAVLWIARTSSSWRDLPSTFGTWNTVFKRYGDQVTADIFAKSFAAVSDEPDLACAMVDGIIVKVHRDRQSAKGGLKARLLASRGAAGPPRSWL